MPQNEQLNQAQVFSTKTAALNQKVHALFANHKPRPLVAGIVFFLESRPLWLKILSALVLVLPVLITGLVLHTLSLVLLSACALLFSGFFIVFFEHYKQAHAERLRGEEQAVDALDEDLSLLTEELRSFSEELAHKQRQVHGEQEAASQQLSALKREGNHLQSSLSDAAGRNKVLLEIKQALMGENHALQTVVAEKIRLLGQKDLRINELESEVRSRLGELGELRLALEQLSRRELVLREQWQALQIEDKKHQAELLSLQQELSSLLAQRQQLVEQIKFKDTELASLHLTKQALEQELDEAKRALAELKVVVSGLEEEQEQLILRIKGLNVRLFEEHLSREKHQQGFAELFNAAQLLQKNNDWLQLQLNKLGEENERLVHSISVLKQVEGDLTQSKAKMAALISALEEQCHEQTRLLAARNEQLELALADYQSTKTKLDGAITELEVVKQSMSAEVDRVKQTQVSITKMALKLSQLAAKEEGDNSSLVSQVQHLLAEKERGSQQVVAEALGLNQRLTMMSEEIKDCLVRHKRVLQLQEEYIVGLAANVVGFFAPQKSGQSHRAELTTAQANTELATLPMVQVNCLA